MGVASRIIGIVLALAGLIFVCLSILFLFQLRPQSVLAGPASGRPAWTGAAFAAVLGVVLLLAGWHYFKLDVDALDDTQDQPTRFALYFQAHRRELKLIAQVGLAISLIRLGALCFGVDWPGRWVTLLLFLAWAALPATDGNTKVEADRRPSLKSVRNAGGVAAGTLMLFLAWSEHSHLQTATRVSEAGIMALLFAWESIKTWSIAVSSR